MAKSYKKHVKSVKRGRRSYSRSYLSGGYISNAKKHPQISTKTKTKRKTKPEVSFTVVENDISPSPSSNITYGGIYGGTFKKPFKTDLRSIESIIAHI